MNTTKTSQARRGIIKGDLCATVVVGNVVNLWFQSPTGDSSDSQILELVCIDNEQAEMVAKRHREVWGIDQNAIAAEWENEGVSEALGWNIK